MTIKTNGHNVHTFQNKLRCADAAKNSPHLTAEKRILNGHNLNSNGGVFEQHKLDYD